MDPFGLDTRFPHSLFFVSKFFYIFIYLVKLLSVFIVSSAVPSITLLLGEKLTGRTNTLSNLTSRAIYCDK